MKDSIVKVKNKIPGPLNILLVEDNLLNVKLMAVLFAQHSMHLQVAANGMEAVEKIKNNNFDMVLMDMEMPVLNGYQATAIIRNELKNNVPIIAMTANTLPGEKDRCLQLGMNDYMAKPIDADLLLKSIEKLTRIRKPVSKKTGITKFNTPAVVTDKVCKLDYLVTVTRGNKKMINNIVGVFMEETPAELSALHDAIKKINYTGISNISHKIKSSFSILGISMLEHVFAEMEHLGTNATGIEKIIMLNRHINLVFNRARVEMQQHIN